MAASIDSVSSALPAEVGDMMKLSLDNTAADLVSKVPHALDLGPSYKLALASIARERYDWMSVAKMLRDELTIISSLSS
jgi:hypothetical protein